MLHPQDINCNIISVFHIHRNNNLFSWQFSSSHVQFQFRLAFTTDDFLNILNFLVLEIGEYFLDFKSFPSYIRISEWCLSI